MGNISTILKGKVSVFVLSRYMTYGVAFIKGIFIAAVLGPYYYGIWGFIVLVSRYLAYTQMGLHNSLNVFLSSSERSDHENASQITSAAFVVNGIIVLILITAAITLKALNIEIVPKYSFNKYGLLVITMVALQHFYNLFINIYRSYGYLFKIALTQFLLQAALLSIIFIFKDENLIAALLWMNIFVYAFAICIFSIRGPVKIRVNFDWTMIKAIVTRGVQLFVYNTSYYLIMVSSRTIVSFSYEVEELGYYTFANSIAIVTHMAFSTIAWVLFPKILYKLRSGISNAKAKALVDEIGSLCVMANFLAIFIAITFFPGLIHFLKQYVPCTTTFAFLVLTQGILAYCFGYAHLAIARKHEMKLSLYGGITILINVCLALLFSLVLKLPFFYVAFGTLISVIFYVIMVHKLGYSILGDPKSVFDILSGMFPVGILVPFVVVLLGNFSRHSIYCNIVGLSLFIILNWKILINGFDRGKLIFTKPNMV